MRLDHLSFACGHEGLAETAERLGRALGAEFVDGGFHPRFGTQNRILPLTDETYLEVVEVLDHPAAEKAPFGQAVRARSEAGGGWLGWVVEVDDLAPVEARLGREAVPGNRYRPDGVELRWRQIGVKGLISDPQLPFVLQWEGDPELHPSTSGSSEVSLSGLQIAGDAQRVLDWLGLLSTFVPPEVAFQFVAPHGTPGLLACTFDTPSGAVTI